MSLEYQRYGRNKETLINNTYIESGEYRKKFDRITDNQKINRILYNKAKEMLKHRSGTTCEDMYWIDGETGKIAAKEISSTEMREIVYSAVTKRTISSYEKNRLIAVHTHPGSMPPSAADFNSCYINGYKLGCVVCHDGRLFVYTSSEQINVTLYNMYIESALKDGVSEYEAQITALEKLKSRFKIDFWEVK